MHRNWIVTNLGKSGGWVSGIAIDNSHSIYYTCGSRGFWKFNPNKPEKLLNFNHIDLRGIVWDNTRNVFYLSCPATHSICRFDTQTMDCAVFAGTGEEGHKDGKIDKAQFYCPWGIAMDKNGDVYVTDEKEVRKIDMNTNTVETIACSTESIPFESLTGIIVGEDGTVYFADAPNYVIYQIKNGGVSLFAGTYAVDAFQNGPIESALFGYVLSMALDLYGNIIVVEVDAIRKIDLKHNMVSSVKLEIEHICRAVTSTQEGDLLFGTRHSLELAVDVWARERLLWIGKLKEDPMNCWFAQLPKEIVKEISGHLRSLAKCNPWIQKKNVQQIPVHLDLADISF